MGNFKVLMPHLVWRSSPSLLPVRALQLAAPGREADAAMSAAATTVTAAKQEKKDAQESLDRVRNELVTANQSLTKVEKERDTAVTEKAAIERKLANTELKLANAEFAATAASAQVIARYTQTEYNDLLADLSAAGGRGEACCC